MNYEDDKEFMDWMGPLAEVHPHVAREYWVYWCMPMAALRTVAIAADDNFRASSVLHYRNGYE